MIIVRCQYEQKGGSEGSTTAVVAFRSADTELRRGYQLGTDFAGGLTAPRSRIFATRIYACQQALRSFTNRLFSFVVGVLFHRQNPTEGDEQSAVRPGQG